MIFVDASAMISLMTGEDDADDLADRLGAEQSRLCSAISVRETIAGLCRTYMFSVPSARATVQSFIELNDLKFVGIGEREFDLATPMRAPSSARTEHGRLLCLCVREGQSSKAAVQGR